MDNGSIRRAERFRLLSEGKELVAYGEKRAVEYFEVGFGNGAADIFKGIVYETVEVFCNALAGFGQGEFILVFLTVSCASGDVALVCQFGYHPGDLCLVHVSRTGKL